MDASNSEYGPRVMLFDIDSSVAEVLDRAAYIVDAGSFGMVYRSDPAHTVPAMPSGHDTHGLAECDIAIVDMAPKQVSWKPPGIPSGQHGAWQDEWSDPVDPRPIIMSGTEDEFSRLLRRGGVLVIIAEPRFIRSYTIGTSLSGRPNSQSRSIRYTNWDFWNGHTRLQIDDRAGETVIVASEIAKTEFGMLLKESTYSCCFRPTNEFSERWLITRLATNRHGELIAARLESKDSVGGVVYLLPRSENLSDYIIEFLEEEIALRRPALFPRLTSASWLHSEEYEVPKVLELRREASRVQKEAETALAQLQDRIRKAELDAALDYALLNGTGSELVRAVIAALVKCGFKDVIDMDAEANKAAQPSALREDIQVRDNDPPLVIDVKGVNGMPADEEALQSQKHAAMRLWDTKRIHKPLTIINHQRGIPPRQRDRNRFRTEIVSAAEELHVGLMTTWDLYCLLRNKAELSWPDETVQPLFYKDGIIEPVPVHYISFGRVVKVFAKSGAVGIVNQESISIGETLVLKIGERFVEQRVESLKIDGVDATAAPAGSNVGISLPPEVLAALKEGGETFKVLHKT